MNRINSLSRFTWKREGSIEVEEERGEGWRERREVARIGGQGGREGGTQGGRKG